MKRKIVLTVAGAFCLALCLALTGFLRTATDGDLYYRTQISCHVEPGVTPEQMKELDLVLADCLAGDETAMDRTELFNEREKTHMADVAKLFDLARLVKLISAILAAALLLTGLLPAGNRRKRLKWGAIVGCILLFVPVLIVVVWAVIDFASAFRAMHLLLFDNELWLMNPETDLMIRMLPEEFFTSFARTLALRTALFALIMPVGLWALSLPQTGALPDNDETQTTESAD